jgi:hypothetical protein
LYCIGRNNTVENNLEYFKRSINITFTLRELRTVCVQYVPAANTTNTKPFIIDRLTNYLQHRLRLPPPPENNDWLALALPADPLPLQPILIPPPPENNGWLHSRPLPLQPILIPPPPENNGWLHSVPLNIIHDDVSDTDDDEEEANNILWFLDTIPNRIPSYLSPNVTIRPPANRNAEPKKYNIIPILDIVEPTTTELGDEEECKECNICYENVKYKKMVNLNCNHSFCGTCINQSIKSQFNPEKNPTCAFCRGTITTFTTQSQETLNLVSVYCAL